METDLCMHLGSLKTLSDFATKKILNVFYLITIHDSSVGSLPTQKN